MSDAAVTVSECIRVSGSIEHAFHAFTVEMAHWWLPEMSLGQMRFESIIMEGWAGGRWFERDSRCRETELGNIVAWDAPDRLKLNWLIGAAFVPDADIVTDIAVDFSRSGLSRSRIALTHSKIERFGRRADRVAVELAAGWKALLASFASHVACG